MVYNRGTNKSTTHPAKREKEEKNKMTDFNTKYLIPGAMYRVTMTDPDSNETQIKTMTGEDLKELAYAAGHLYDMTADIIETTETTETTETAPAAEPETETETAERAAEINPMCTDCVRRGSDCDGTTCETWTGCIYRETAAQRDIRLFDFYKRRLLALAGGEPLRWVCVQYLCSFPGLSPYDMGAELIAEGVEIIYDDTAITRAENAAERRRVQRAYAAREGARA